MGKGEGELAYKKKTKKKGVDNGNNYLKKRPSDCGEAEGKTT